MGWGGPWGKEKAPVPFPHTPSVCPLHLLSHMLALRFPFSPFLSSSVPFWFPVSLPASASLLA